VVARPTAQPRPAHNTEAHDHRSPPRTAFRATALSALLGAPIGSRGHTMLPPVPRCQRSARRERQAPTPTAVPWSARSERSPPRRADVRAGRTTPRDTAGPVRDIFDITHARLGLLRRRRPRSIWRFGALLGCRRRRRPLLNLLGYGPPANARRGYERDEHRRDGLRHPPPHRGDSSNGNVRGSSGRPRRRTTSSRRS
jgi:hypothetical protein